METGAGGGGGMRRRVAGEERSPSGSGEDGGSRRLGEGRRLEKYQSGRLRCPYPRDSVTDICTPALFISVSKSALYTDLFSKVKQF